MIRARPGSFSLPLHREGEVVQFHSQLEEALQAGITRMNYSGEQIKKALDLIHDAAAQNELWRDVLTAIADLTNS